MLLYKKLLLMTFGTSLVFPQQILLSSTTYIFANENINVSHDEKSLCCTLLICTKDKDNSCLSCTAYDTRPYDSIKMTQYSRTQCDKKVGL